MVCKVCSADIPKGKRYTTEDYKSLRFCSETCYLKYKEEHKPKPEPEKMPGIDKLKDYIKALYPYELVWSGVTQQIKSLCKEYDITCTDILLTIKYGMEYANHDFDSQYMLGQFVPRYLHEAMDFANAIQANRALAKEWEPTDKTYVVKRGKPRMNKNCEW